MQIENRTRYTPFICDDKNYISNNFIPSDIAIELKKAFHKLNQYIQTTSNYTQPIDWLKNKLQIQSHEVENFNNMLSFEQMDAVALAIFNLETQKPICDFILADTMGNGKGRILASILRYSLVNNRNVIFFTISDGLFTAFYADLKAVGALPFIKNDIFIMHGSGRIYDEGKLIKKSIGSESLQSLYTSGKINEKPDVIFSTYSQISTSNTVESKIKFLSKIITQDTIILFDEFHKSLGQSTTRNSRTEILKIGGSSIRSSATFISKYEHIESYLSFFKLKDRDKLAINVFKQNPKEYDLNLNSQITRQLTRQGLLIRRENEESGTPTPIYLSEYEMTQINHNLSCLRDVFYEMFECHWYLQQMDKDAISSKWQMFGGLISRLTDTIITFGKKDHIIKLIEQSIDKNRKVILTLESTFESNIQQAIALIDNVKNTTWLNPNLLSQSKWENKRKVYKDLNFKTLLLNSLKNLFGEQYTEFQKLGEDNDFTQAFQRALKFIQDFPEIPLSFIDDIHAYFNNRGDNVLEISGRRIIASKNNQGEYTINKREFEDKAIIAHKFNNGWFDHNTKSYKNSNLIILTVAGFTGVSLQSHFSYKDKRQRHLIEGQETNKENEREQSYGRPNRRGQVNTPILESLKTLSLFETRKSALNLEKAERMKSFTSNQNNSLENLYTDDINETAYQFCQRYAMEVRYIGLWVNLTKDHRKNHYIDTLLKRSVLLPDYVQTSLKRNLEQAAKNQQISDNSHAQNIELPFVKDVKFSKVTPFWQHTNCDDNEIEQIQKINKLDVFNTELPIIYKTLATNTFQIQENDVVAIRNELLNKYKNFDREKYIRSASNIKFDSTSQTSLKELHIASQISFTWNGCKLFGFIENIDFLNTDNDGHIFPINYLYTIRLVNPKILAKNMRAGASADTIVVNGLTLLKSGDLSISNKKIDWDKYKRNNEILEQEFWLLVGNVFYLNLFRQVFSIGHSISFPKKMPNSTLPEYIYAIRLNNTANPDEVKSSLEQRKLAMSTLDVAQFCDKEKGWESTSGNVIVFFSNTLKPKGAAYAKVIALKKEYYEKFDFRMLNHSPFTKPFLVNKEWSKNYVFFPFEKNKYFMSAINMLCFDKQENQPEITFLTQKTTEYLMKKLKND